MAELVARAASRIKTVAVLVNPTEALLDEVMAADSYRLDGAEVCLEQAPEILANMPYYLNYLSARSHDVYTRIHRLDQMAYGDATSRDANYNA
jgi:hypothetical protein